MALNRRGRKPGVPNVAGASAKENILAVFTRLDGTAGMAEWAKKHPTEFYKLYGRLIPTEGTLEVKLTLAQLVQQAAQIS